MSKRNHKKTNPTETIVAASGTIAGAAMGSIAGPVGTIAGAIVGSVAGAAAGAVLEDEDAREALHEEQLDEEIGVYDGTLGAAPEDAPPARIGAFSAGSSGAGRKSVPPSEGPIPEAEK
jgi:phage tail tape-measure protein